MSDEPSHGLQPGSERIGQRLIRVGALTETQVSEILIRQRTEAQYDKLFGEVAVELGYLDDATLNRYLDGQS